MDAVEFEWHDSKDALNRRKHGISFSEAVTIWRDDRALEIADPDHSQYEERWIRIGMSLGSKILVVVFIEKAFSTRIRVISARKATRREEEQYFSRRI